MVGSEWTEHREEPQIQEKEAECYLESNEEPLMSFKHEATK